MLSITNSPVVGDSIGKLGESRAVYRRKYSVARQQYGFQAVVCTDGCQTARLTQCDRGRLDRIEANPDSWGNGRVEALDQNTNQFN